MTAMSFPDQLLSLADFDELPEDNSRRYELLEGVLYVSPKAASLHQRVVKRLVQILDSQLPHDWEALPEAEVAVRQQWPPTVRIPDVAVVATSRVDENPKRFHAQDLALVVEVVSPGSRETDQVMKRHEYAKAGIPCYWIVDLESDRATLTENLLGENGVYQVQAETSERFSTTEPWNFSLDLTQVTSGKREG